MLVIHIFLLLMVGFSAQVGAYDEVPDKTEPCYRYCRVT